MSATLLRRIQVVALYQGARPALLNSKRISQTESPRLGSLEPCAQLSRLNRARTLIGPTDTVDRAGRHMETIT
jgi:hypothetical protein